MSVGDKFDKLFERLKQEFQKQTIDITDSLITNLSKKIDEKIRPIHEENTLLSEELGKLQTRIEYLERDSKRNNIVIFGAEETEENKEELLNGIKKKIIDDLNISLEKSEINNVYRIGKRNKENTKPRPIVVSFVNAWKRDEVLRHRKKFQIIRVSEDFPKAVIEKRKLWISEMKEERSKGKVAYLVYDKLLVKPKANKNEDVNKLPSLSGSITDTDQSCNTNSNENTSEKEINTLFDKPLFLENAIENKINEIFQNPNSLEEVKESEGFNFKRGKRKIPSHYGY